MGSNLSVLNYRISKWFSKLFRSFQLGSINSPLMIIQNSCSCDCLLLICSDITNERFFPKSGAQSIKYCAVMETWKCIDPTAFPSRSYPVTVPPCAFFLFPSPCRKQAAVSSVEVRVPLRVPCAMVVSFPCWPTASTSLSESYAARPAIPTA